MPSCKPENSDVSFNTLIKDPVPFIHPFATCGRSPTLVWVNIPYLKSLFFGMKATTCTVSSKNENGCSYMLFTLSYKSVTPSRTLLWSSKFVLCANQRSDGSWTLVTGAIQLALLQEHSVLLQTSRRGAPSASQITPPSFSAPERKSWCLSQHAFHSISPLRTKMSRELCEHNDQQ